ncbi:acyl-CoA dehydrogenase family protein [Variovorax sp. LT1R16]|uniref:acyl-CoA dehydrogenase family protein n=1 Tax=Variovorax sp. LT1R16 TaxID=3443728 RepID=UPI003F456C33
MDSDYGFHADVIRKHIELVPGYEALRSRLAPVVDVSPESIQQILDAAAQFAEDVLVPINRAGDVEGCRIEDGRVKTASGYPEAWKSFAEGGWNSVDQPETFGGQGLPTFVNAACRELFDRACMAIGMVSGPTRAATQVLEQFAPKELQEEWIPKFVTGEWAATICISEADAGSDVGRIRTRAIQGAEGTWRLTGEKMWTTFGDNDLVQRIGHLVLGRTPDAPAGSAGLSLFLVPNLVRDASGALAPNGVKARRIEEKLGLHGSPTCAMGFEDAQCHLLGKPHRGLAQMFVMIQTMRQMVAIEGVGMAFGAEQVANRYAADRRQGGSPSQPPVAINTHADVQRQLLTMASRVEVLHGLVYEMVIRIDAQQLDSASAAGQRPVTDNVAQWLLPIVKASCADAGHEVPDEAIQVLGGAGYTTEWPAEQWMRDARMMSIAEGTTGVQALDLIHRRLWRDNGAALSEFLAVASSEISQADIAIAAPAADTLALLRSTGDHLLTLQGHPKEAEAGAVAFLRLAMLAATGWIAVRLSSAKGDDRVTKRLVAAGSFWLSDLEERASFVARQATAGASSLAFFEHI